MVNDEQLAFCKKNFYYLNYLYRERINYYQGSVNLDIIPLHIFFNETHMQNVFSLYKTFYDNPHVLIEGQRRQSGFSTFCCFLAYYICFSTERSVLYVTDSKIIPNTKRRLIELTKSFKNITRLDATYNGAKRFIEFSNGAKIGLYSDTTYTTYDFKNLDEIPELLIFDNASMKNFDKFCNTIQDIIFHNHIAKRVIINFNDVPPLFYGTENYEIFIKEFKNYLTIINVDK